MDKLVEADLDDVLKDLEDLNEFDDDDDDSDDADDSDEIEPTIIIPFPVNCSMHLGVHALKLSIRDVLTMFAHFASEHDAELARTIRDSYYTDPDSWCGQLGFLSSSGGFSPEERALARWEASKLPKAEAGELSEFDLFGEGETEMERLRRKHPDAFAKTDEEADRQGARAEALNAEYDAFVAAIKAAAPPAEEWIAARRAELQAKTDQLIADNRALWDAESKVIDQFVSVNSST